MNLVADASAVLAVLLDEADADVYVSKLLLAGKVWISPVNWWEVQVRMRSIFGEAGERAASRWMGEIGIMVEPLTDAHAQLALSAHVRFRGRPARLNMGDCFAYALAKANDAPLLFKGGDFGNTDVRSA